VTVSSVSILTILKNKCKDKRLIKANKDKHINLIKELKGANSICICIFFSKFLLETITSYIDGVIRDSGKSMTNKTLTYKLKRTIYALVLSRSIRDDLPNLPNPDEKPNDLSNDKELRQRFEARI
jgi:hypothetical protein